MKYEYTSFTSFDDSLKGITVLKYYYCDEVVHTNLITFLSMCISMFSSLYRA